VDRGMSPAVMKRLEDGNWQSALVMSELVRYYWRKTRGSEWSSSAKVDPALPIVERVEQGGLF